MFQQPEQPKQSTRQPRFNLKISPLLRPRFEEPYDAYLNHLLELSKDLTTFEPLQIDGKASKTTAGQNRWTVWVSREIRDRFAMRKQVLAPSKTHGQFIELLLLYKESLVEKGYPVSFHSQNEWTNQSPMMRDRPNLEIRTSSNPFPSPNLDHRRSSPDIYSASPRSFDGISPVYQGRSYPMTMHRSRPMMIQQAQFDFLPSPDMQDARGSYDPLDSLFEGEPTETFSASYSSYHHPSSMSNLRYQSFGSPLPIPEQPTVGIAIPGALSLPQNGSMMPQDWNGHPQSLPAYGNGSQFSSSASLQSLNPTSPDTHYLDQYASQMVSSSVNSFFVPSKNESWMQPESAKSPTFEMSNIKLKDEFEPKPNLELKHFAFHAQPSFSSSVPF
ncbi:hypothetical protein EDD86DRAFT_204238 [Gorgonomyces haynaldii]|nr:hypothetical protein EDD86DRAFT_204238 [Gorgonomyces haynaldii]